MADIDLTRITISGNPSSAVAAFQRASSAARTAGSQITAALRGISGAIGGIGAGLSIGGLGLFVKASIDAADALNDISKRTGVAATTIGGIGFAAQQAGGDVEGAAQAFRAFNKVISEALGGNKEAIDNFSKLGISLSDLQKSTPDQLLIKTADAFASFADGAEKAAGATVFFGKGAASIVGVLDEGGESLRKNIEYWQQYSGVTDDLVRASDQFNDSLTKISLIQRSFGAYLASSLLPSMQALADYLLNAKNNSNAFERAAESVADVIKTLAKAAIVTGGAFKLMGDFIAAGAAQLSAVARLDFSSVFNIGKEWRSDFSAATSSIRELLGVVDSASRRSSALSESVGGITGRRRSPNFTGTSGGSGAGRETKAIDEYARALDRVQKELREANAEYAALFSGEILTKTQKELSRLVDSDEWKKFTKPQQDYIRGIYEQIVAIEKQTDVWKESQEIAKKEADLMRDLAEQQDRLFTQFRGSLADYEARNDYMREEIDLVGKDEAAHRKLSETLEFRRLQAEAVAATDLEGARILEEAYQKRLDLIDELAAKVREFNNTEQIRSIFSDSFADEITAVVTGTKKLSDAFLDMERQIVASISRIAAQNIAEAIFGKSGGGGFFGELFKSIGSALPAFAGGTNFAPGGLALVGERGPEVVSLPRGSKVMPNGKSMGNVISINVNVPSGTSGASADRIAMITGQAVQRAMRRNG